MSFVADRLSLIKPSPTITVTQKARDRAGLDADFWKWVGTEENDPREMLKAALATP